MQHQNWLNSLRRDPESGQLKSMFANNINKLKKVRKGIDKLAKSGTTGITQAVKKQLRPKKKTDVAMEEFEVEIGELN